MLWAGTAPFLLRRDLVVAHHTQTTWLGHVARVGTSPRALEHLARILGAGGRSLVLTVPYAGTQPLWAAEGTELVLDLGPGPGADLGPGRDNETYPGLRPGHGTGPGLAGRVAGEPLFGRIVLRKLKPMPHVVLRLAEALPPAPRRGVRSLAVASGKGGTGKTSVALNLAASLVQEGFAPVLLDGDVGMGNVGSYLKVGAGKHLGQVLGGECTGKDLLLESKRMLEGEGGPPFAVIPGLQDGLSASQISPWVLSRLVAACTELEGEADPLILDAGAGAGPVVLNLLAFADALLLVTQDEPPALLDTYALLKAFSFLGRRPPVYLILNRVHQEREAQERARRFSAHVRETLGLAVTPLAVLPEDPTHRGAVLTRRPLVEVSPDAPYSRALHRAAGYLVQTLWRRRGVMAAR